VPKPPPAAEEVKPTVSKPPPIEPPPGVTTPSAGAAPPPPPPPKRRSRITRWLFNLIILSALSYGIGVYYALTSDNWHDFFTEYIPYGEDVVLYFEEREFRKRFLNRQTESHLQPQVRGEAKVLIPSRAGVEVKHIANPQVDKGRHNSAVEAPHPQVANIHAKEQGPTESSTHKLLPDDALKEAPKTPTPVTAKVVPEPAPPAAASSQPAKSEPAGLIDNLTVDHATEPVVQDVIKILNDIIIVINADNASGKYASTIDKAKGALSKVIADISVLKEKEQIGAEEALKKLHGEFDEAAKDMLRLQEQRVQEMELQWREEYETERTNLSDQYDSKLQEELDSAKKVYDQMLKNELLKQDIALRRDFANSIKSTVETERSGRLGKLDELSSSVADLEKLTGEWTSVVDETLKTQHLLVAVEAVRSLLETAVKPTPFTSELAALKEVADDNAVVNAAVASINPLAYQKGVPTTGQLIDRFRRVASEVRKAALLPENAGVASHAASLLLSKVMFKKSGIPVGDDVESVLTRAEMLLEEGSLEDAVREVNSLTGWAKTLSRDWLGESRRVLEVQQALDVSFITPNFDPVSYANNVSRSCPLKQDFVAYL
jgi:MICOS complex subunit MIC60